MTPYFPPSILSSLCWRLEIAEREREAASIDNAVTVPDNNNKQLQRSISAMEQLERAKKKLKIAHEKLELDYRKHTQEQNEFENKLLERIRILDEKKQAAADKYGDLDASDDDRVEINAGGKIISARRSVLCQLKGTRLEALFSGRWDKKLQRDGSGRIFLDVSPKAFRAMVDYLNELAISGEDDIPKLPVEGEGEMGHMLYDHFDLFGLYSSTLISESNIISTHSEVNVIQQWLQEAGAGGGTELIYRSSRDGVSNKMFHEKCDNVGPTLVLIRTTSGGVLGGFTNVSWQSSGKLRKANRAFLFALTGFGEGSPCKMKLKDVNDSQAVFDCVDFGPMFGTDMIVIGGCTVNTYLGCNYEPCPVEQLNEAGYKIKEMEVFAVSDFYGPKLLKKLCSYPATKVPAINLFAKEINEAINEKWETLHALEKEVLSQEVLFENEEHFVESFASGDRNDLITLDVSGTIMVTKRATLQFIDGSVLAQQFDDTKWTEQGSNKTRVKEWSSAEVCNWVKNIKGMQEDVSTLFESNGINGSELLALSESGLEKMGVVRVGTTCLLIKEIKLLEQKSQDVSTLIEYSPYCFGKILDFLRMKYLHSMELVNEPSLPSISEVRKERFEKVVKYYFPGETSKLILGDANSVLEHVPYQ